MSFSATESLSVFYCKAKLLNLIKHIRLSWEWLAVTNAQAYHIVVLIIGVKSLIEQTPGLASISRGLSSQVEHADETPGANVIKILL